MSNKKVPTHIIFTGVYVVLALVTLIPNASASKECLLGYKALCSFSPINTVLILGLAVLHIFLYTKSQAKEISQ